MLINGQQIAVEDATTGPRATICMIVASMPCIAFMMNLQDPFLKVPGCLMEK